MIVFSLLHYLKQRKLPTNLVPAYLTDMSSAARWVGGVGRVGPLLQEVLLARRGGGRGQDQETLLHQPHS